MREYVDMRGHLKNLVKGNITRQEKNLKGEG
jgi:hypothetical protein